VKGGAVELIHDADHNIAYLRFRPDAQEVETIRVSDELNIDIAPDGTVFGIELLNANEQLGNLVLVNPGTDQRREISLRAG
jgi:uncharacterized protein YuzE